MESKVGESLHSFHRFKIKRYVDYSVVSWSLLKDDVIGFVDVDLQFVVLEPGVDGVEVLF